jgi:hypothetical protein
MHEKILMLFITLPQSSNNFYRNRSTHGKVNSKLTTAKLKLLYIYMSCQYKHSRATIAQLAKT